VCPDKSRSIEICVRQGLLDRQIVKGRKALQRGDRPFGIAPTLVRVSVDVNAAWHRFEGRHKLGKFAFEIFAPPSLR